ncbi:GntR family transcriptional regulator [Micromonospora sp. NPDC048830]|uniref:GntR family transcriptional regulator n=1 Tax=Micromonospora sp. NPDC048830 TaxID=3364257 RepID=UPI00371A258D
MPAKYEAVLQDLSQRIADMTPGERLPSEQQLAKDFDVSTMTVRRALQVLIDAKRVIGIRGRGTFVAQPTVSKFVLASFTESMRAAGMSARTEVLSAGLNRADKEVAERLEIEEGEQVISLTRLRFGDGTPLCLEYSVLRAAQFPGILGLNLEGSLYELLRKRFDVELSRVELRITAVMASAEEAKLLGIDPQAIPCIKVKSSSKQTDGLIAEDTISIYRGDRYELIVGAS